MKQKKKKDQGAFLVVKGLGPIVVILGVKVAKSDLITHPNILYCESI